MRSRGLIAIAGAALGLAWQGGGAMAQTAPPGHLPAPAPHHRLFGHRPTGTTAGSRVPFAGAIIGNKRTHVYHLAGAKGSLPAEKNRVYFHSEAEARAAGYHPAGQRRTTPQGARPHAAPAARALSGSGNGR